MILAFSRIHSEICNDNLPEFHSERNEKKTLGTKNQTFVVNFFTNLINKFLRSIYSAQNVPDCVKIIKYLK